MKLVQAGLAAAFAAAVAGIGTGAAQTPEEKYMPPTTVTTEHSYTLQGPDTLVDVAMKVSPEGVFEPGDSIVRYDFDQAKATYLRVFRAENGDVREITPVAVMKFSDMDEGTVGDALEMGCIVAAKHYDVRDRFPDYPYNDRIDGFLKKYCPHP